VSSCFGHIQQLASSLQAVEELLDALLALRAAECPAKVNSHTTTHSPQSVAVNMVTESTVYQAQCGIRECTDMPAAAQPNSCYLFYSCCCHTTTPEVQYNAHAQQKP
jgi:hypothetical protein